MALETPKRATTVVVARFGNWGRTGVRPEG